jgi:hypothetical protein
MYISIINEQKCLFLKMENRKLKQVLPGGWHQWGGRGYKETMQEGEYGGNTTYSCMNMEKRDLLKLFQE